MRYDGKSPEYDEPANEADSSNYAEEPKPTGVITGTQVLSLGAVLAARPSSAGQVLRWLTDDKFARPLVLIVDVKSTQAPSPADPFAGEGLVYAQASGAAAGAAGELGGVLRVSYGQGNTVRVLEADLRGGTFEIPTCSTCTVEAFLYCQGPGNVTVNASLLPGRVVAPGRLVNSFRATLAAGASITEKVPFGARWVSMSGGAPTGIGAGQPQLALTQGTSGPLILQDYVAGTLIGAPGQAVELAGRADVTVKNNGGASANVNVRFYLEP